MNLEINIEDTITQALQAAMAPERIREQIEKQIATTVDAAIKDAFREYSDFGKAVKTAVAAITPHELSLDGAASWNHAIKQIIAERMAAMNDERIKQAMNPMLDKLLEQPPAEITLSELVRKAAEMWDESHLNDGCHAPQVSVTQEDHVLGKVWHHVKLHPTQRKSYETWDVQFGVTDDGSIYALRVQGADVKQVKFAGPYYSFEAYLFALYTGATKVIVDAYDFEDICYSSREHDD